MERTASKTSWSMRSIFEAEVLVELKLFEVVGLEYFFCRLEAGGVVTFGASDCEDCGWCFGSRGRRFGLSFSSEEEEFVTFI
jgi:hypothetical protein